MKKKWDGLVPFVKNKMQSDKHAWQPVTYVALGEFTEDLEFVELQYAAHGARASLKGRSSRRVYTMGFGAFSDIIDLLELGWIRGQRWKAEKRGSSFGIVHIGPVIP